MPTVISKLFAGQGTEQTDRQSGDYMLPPFGGHKNTESFKYQEFKF